MERGILIGGDWVVGHSSRSFTTVNPATGEVLAELPQADDADAAAAVSAATAALPAWAALDAAERGRILLRLADLLEARGDRIARIETADNGRPVRETLAQAGIVGTWYRYFAGMADKLEGATIPVRGPYLNYTRRVPVGVCVAITPWNHPTLIASKKIAPALAFGNTVVVKPSELAPLGVMEMVRLAAEAGLPPGVLNLLSGDGETGAALVADPRVARIDVTGSTRTGIAIARAAAAGVKRVGLELGGAASSLVFADADLNRSVRGTVFAALVAQGQSCVAASRILVERSVAEQFGSAVAAMVRALRVGDPRDEATQVGPLITPGAAARVHAYIEKATSAGATVLTGGSLGGDLGSGLRPDGFHQPTVLWSDHPHTELFADEVFGPVITVIPVADEDEAVRVANSTPFGLGAGVWTGNLARAHRVAGALRAGVTWINDYHRIDAASPWGGFGQSGYGRENGFPAAEMFTELKSVWVGLDEPRMNWYDPRDDADPPARLN